MIRRQTWLVVFALCGALSVSEAVWAQPKDAPGITVNKEKREVSIPCKIAPRKLAYLTEIYPIEVIACWPHPQGKKAHETIVVFDVKPSDVHKALGDLGLKPGKPVKGEGVATGPEVKVFLEIPVEGGGEPRRLPIEKAIVDRTTGKTMPALKWFFTGSALSQPDPNKNEKVYGADLTGTLISVFPVTDETVLQSNLTSKDEPLIKMETNKKVLPPEGAPVTLVVQVK